MAVCAGVGMPSMYAMPCFFVSAIGSGGSVGGCGYSWRLVEGSCCWLRCFDEQGGGGAVRVGGNVLIGGNA